MWMSISEFLGDQSYVAKWMYQHTGESYYKAIGFNLGQIIAIDVIPGGALPVIFTDVVVVDSYDWGADELRRNDFAAGIYEACKSCGMALIQGETGAAKYLVKPGQSVLSGSITGIIVPKERLITGRKLQIGDHIIAAKSSGIQSNGSSLVIKRAKTLKDQFLHKLPNGKTLGEESLKLSCCYVKLMEALLNAQPKIDFHAVQPGTGGGLLKIAYDKRPFTYRIHSWFDEIPPLFTFMRELGVTLYDCLITFNWGSGFYIFVPLSEVEQTIDVGKQAGYELMDVGVVEKGPRRVIFEPESITLSPPGE
jgi:phosphoribosylformylglycinamidine cyclo-ligase